MRPTAVLGAVAVVAIAWFLIVSLSEEVPRVGKPPSHEAQADEERPPITGGTIATPLESSKFEAPPELDVAPEAASEAPDPALPNESNEPFHHRINNTVWFARRMLSGPQYAELRRIVDEHEHDREFRKRFLDAVFPIWDRCNHADNSIFSAADPVAEEMVAKGMYERLDIRDSPARFSSLTGEVVVRQQDSMHSQHVFKIIRIYPGESPNVDKAKAHQAEVAAEARQKLQELLPKLIQ